jgi:hypothetical protein
VPWDIDKNTPLSTLFGITVTNYWTDGGKLEKINNLYLKIPEKYDISPNLCNREVKLAPEISEEGYKIYKLTNPVEDIEDFVTVNCMMTVPHESLGTYPVTAHFLKTKVEYDYIIERSIPIDIEGYSTPELLTEYCCRFEPTKDSITYTKVTDCVDTSTTPYVEARVVDMAYCEKVCCHIIDRGGEANRFTTPEECIDNSPDYFGTVVEDKEKCPVEK